MEGSNAKEVGRNKLIGRKVLFHIYKIKLKY